MTSEDDAVGGGGFRAPAIGPRPPALSAWAEVRRAYEETEESRRFDPQALSG